MSAPEVAVGAVVVRAGALLMVRRGRPPAQGLWTIPGGRVERGESLADGLRREVREETGLSVEVGSLLGVHEVIGDHHFVILDYEASCNKGEPVAGDDVAEARWVPLAEVTALETTPQLPEILEAWGIPL